MDSEAIDRVVLTLGEFDTLLKIYHADPDFITGDDNSLSLISQKIFTGTSYAQCTS